MVTIRALTGADFKLMVFHFPSYLFVEASGSTPLSMQSAFRYSNHRKTFTGGSSTTYKVSCNIMQKYTVQYIIIAVLIVLSAAEVLVTQAKLLVLPMKHVYDF